MLPSEIPDSAGLDSNEVPGFNLQISKGRVASEASSFTGEPDSSQRPPDALLELGVLFAFKEDVHDQR